MNCKKCKSVIDSKTSFLTCFECKNSFHLRCISNLTQPDFEYYQSSQTPWCCLVCEKNKTKKGDDTPVTPTSEKLKPSFMQSSENSDSDRSDKGGVKQKIPCGICSKGYSFNAHRAECTKCKTTFHFKCLNTTKDEFDRNKRNWQCTTCRDTKSPSVHTVTPIQSGGAGGTMMDVLNEMRQFRLEVQKTNQEYVESLRTFREEVYNKNLEFTDHLKKYSDWIDDYGKQMQELSTNIATLMKDYEEMRQENLNLKKTNAILTRQVNSLEQSARDKTVEIHGIPLKEKENVMEVVKQVADAIAFDFREEMVDTCYRLRTVGATPPDRPAGIVVRFVRRIDKEQFIDLRRKKRNLNTRDLGFMEGNASVVYINDSLTSERRKLFNAARNVKREKLYTFLWVKNGKIFMRKNQGDRFVVIESQDDLNKLL